MKVILEFDMPDSGIDCSRCPIVCEGYRIESENEFKICSYTGIDVEYGYPNKSSCPLRIVESGDEK